MAKIQKDDKNVDNKSVQPEVSKLNADNISDTNKETSDAKDTTNIGVTIANEMKEQGIQLNSKDDLDKAVEKYSSNQQDKESEQSSTLLKSDDFRFWDRTFPNAISYAFSNYVVTNAKTEIVDSFMDTLERLDLRRDMVNLNISLWNSRNNKQYIAESNLDSNYINTILLHLSGYSRLIEHLNYVMITIMNNYFDANEHSLKENEIFLLTESFDNRVDAIHQILMTFGKDCELLALRENETYLDTFTRLIEENSFFVGGIIDVSKMIGLMKKDALLDKTSSNSPHPIFRTQRNYENNENVKTIESDDDTKELKKNEAQKKAVILNNISYRLGNATSLFRNMENKDKK